MNHTPALEKAKAYINVQTNLPPRESLHLPHGEDGPFITISRAAGSGGSTFAKALVATLNARRDGNEPPWTVFDSEIVQQVLAEAHLPSRLARFLPEDRIPAVVAAVGEIVGLHPDLWTLVRRTNETVRRLAMLGHTVIVGRGGNFATEGISNGLNIRLIGSADGRARRAAEVHRCSIDDALVMNRKIDAARSDYVRSAFDRNIDEIEAYDLVMNTDSLSTAEAVEASLSILGRRKIASSGARG